MFTLPIWVAVLYGILMLLALFLVFLLSTIVDRQKHLIEQAPVLHPHPEGRGPMTAPMFRPTPNGIVAIVELSQSDLDHVLGEIDWNTDLALRLREAAIMVRKMEALS